ncbi:bifunctional endoribonuclease/protein kinase ire1 [Zalaria obscura]|uniref:Bifunctional endoribonuclease/protein kinase ire1 n=1 Tax=Zalaria obscura TaxID=2024903 RepID=A0ACC3SE40_9PEZI
MIRYQLNVPARSSAPSAGLTSRHPARSLQDWQVEDIILLATVDGKIHARDRKTGAPRWELEADRPMVETTYHRNNKSTSSEVPAEGDYLWIVEPSQDGSLYVYSPGPRVGMQKLGLTVKQLVEELSPYAGEDPPVVYTADKKNTLYTVDAATGNVLKMFSASGSVTNDDRNCRRVDALEEGLKNEACGSVGTLTLGRTEYTVAIQDRETGEPICTIRYFEWGPNIRDKDLHNQYASTLDNAYVYSKHDGSIFAWDHTETDGYSTSWPQRPMYRHKFSSPVARVYDVVRQYDDDSTDASLVILPQPIGPTGGLPELTTVFVNCTESGSWYALSEQSYPTVTDGATRASCYYDSWYLDPDGEDIPVSGSVLAKQRAKLVGVHPLSALSSERPNIPTISGPEARDTISLPAGGMSDDGDLLIDEPRRSWLDSLPPTWTIIIMLLLLVPIIQKKFPSLGDKLLSSRKYIEQLLGQRVTTAQMLDSVPTVTVTEPDDKPASNEVKEETPSSEPPKIREAEPAVETVFAHADKPSESELEPTLSADDDTAPAQPEAETTAAPADTPQEGTPVKPKKKATRGVRGGKKQKEKKAQQQEAQQRKRKDSQLDKISDSDVEALTKVESHRDEKAIEVISVPDSENPNFKGKIQINNLVINTDRVLGHGSAGTCVFEGSFEGDPVAVKRMLSQYYELASSEVSFLKQSDYHPNVVRYFCQQRDQHFLYIAVELCQASLWDLYYSDTRDEQRRAELSHLLSIIQTDVPKALHQLAAGLHHLHEMRIIHRDIKPQNILIAYPRRNQKLRLVISDFGLCKTLPENVSTLVDPTSNAGTCGWKAPELILQPKDSASNNGSFPGGQSTTDSATGTGATSGVKRAADIFIENGPTEVDAVRGPR